MYRSLDSMASVENLSLDGLRVSQYYSTLTSLADPEHLAAGSQDQGYQLSLAPAAAGTIKDFQQVIGGDYGHLRSGTGTFEYVFGSYPFLLLVMVGTQPSIPVIENIPPGEFHAWLPPLEPDPADPKNVLWCGERIWLYVKDASANDWTPQLYSAQSFAASPQEYISAFAFSPLQPSRAYLATSAGRLFVSNDTGVTWTQSVSGGPIENFAFSTAIHPSELDPELVYVGGSGYSSASVLRSQDGGVTWGAWEEGLPDTLVYSLAEAPDGSGTLFAGTEQSAYRRSASGAGWVEITGAAAPVTTYWSVEAVPAADAMRFGTHGRGVWDYAHTPSSLTPYGCRVNPAGSLVHLGGSAAIGDVLTLGLDNPLGTQGTATPLVQVALAADPAFPCGSSLPGFGMAGPGAAGELLLSLAGPLPPAVAGSIPWASPGTPAPVDLPVPLDSGLVGQTVYAQGLLVDPVAAGGVGLALTEALAIQVGS